MFVIIALTVQSTVVSQNYSVFGLFPSPGILETRIHDVSEAGYMSVLR
jgi:hypothetical protein